MHEVDGTLEIPHSIILDFPNASDSAREIEKSYGADRHNYIVGASGCVMPVEGTLDACLVYDKYVDISSPTLPLDILLLIFSFSSSISSKWSYIS